jgi:hypothetical protein
VSGLDTEYRPPWERDYHPARRLPLLKVNIIDDLSWGLLADVDATSTADALAYFLRTRAETLRCCVRAFATLSRPTPATVAARRAYAAYVVSWPSTSDAPAIYEERNPLSGELEVSLIAEAHE